jgi:hypothetical protein
MEVTQLRSQQPRFSFEQGLYEMSVANLRQPPTLKVAYLAIQRPKSLSDVVTIRH